MFKTYQGEQCAQLCPQLGRKSRRSTTSSGKDYSGGRITKTGPEVANTSFSDLLFSLRCALISYQNLYVLGGLVANSCNGGHITVRHEV